MYTEINRKHTEPSTGNQQRYMTEGVGNIEPSTAGWVANSRLIPAAFPAKSVSDWDYRTGPLTEARHFEEEFFSCPFSNHAEAAPVYRYMIHSITGVRLFIWHNVNVLQMSSMHP
jgi:hypothetical protein